MLDVDELYAQIQERRDGALRLMQQHRSKEYDHMADYYGGRADAYQIVLDLLEELDETQPVRG